ncbi:MAG: VOC family protein [Burkholderiaceae bacterium]|jgi:catechol 2,3-dioxygenase-like lactoylglutathione lyase family enzyme
MSAPGFDHVGLIVPDLERSRARFEAMGFCLSARADHTMSDPQGRTVSAGSSQHTLMLPEGYVELMQITDPGSPHPLAAAPAARFGLHVLALSVRDAEEAHAAFDAASRQPGADPAARVGALRRWSRPVREPDREGIARFAFFDSPWDPNDPSYFCFVEHLTPELLRSPADCEHANGARSVREICYVGPLERVAAFARRLAAFGLPARPDSGASTIAGLRTIGAMPAPQTRGAGRVLPALVVALGDTVLRLEIDAEAVALRPVAVELSFDSIDALASGCRGSGIACTPWPGSDRSPGAAPAASRRDAGRPRVRRLAVDIGEQCGLTLIASS